MNDTAPVDARRSLAIAPTGGILNVVPANMQEAIEFARLMSKTHECVRQAFRDKPGACLAVALQAWRDGGDPFAYANHAYIVNNQIAYEAKLINGIVNTKAPLARRLRTTYSGDGQSRRCKITGWLRGEDEPFEYESPPIKDIKVQNSPLWKNDPDQQLYYFSVRSWARRHVPEIMIGIYAPDEMGEVIDITPTHVVQEASGPAEREQVAELIPWEVIDHTGEVHAFERADSAVEACRRMLIAAAADPATLAIVWENNAGFILSLGQDGREEDAQAIERLHAELAPRNSRPEPEPAQSSSRAPAAERPDAVDVAETAHGPSASGHPTEAQESAQDERNAPPASPAAETASPASSPALPQPAATQTAERHDAFWDKASLRIDPAPDRRDRNAKDWRTWPALLTPRIRQAWSMPLLNALYQDNQDNLALYGQAVGQRDADEIASLFEDARARIGV